MQVSGAVSTAADARLAAVLADEMCPGWAVFADDGPGAVVWWPGGVAAVVWHTQTGWVRQPDGMLWLDQSVRDRLSVLLDRVGARWGRPVGVAVVDGQPFGGPQPLWGVRHQMLVASPDRFVGWVTDRSRMRFDWRRAVGLPPA